MRRFALSLLMMFCLLNGQANVLSPFLMMEVDTAEYVSPMDTTVYMPPVDTTHYEPVDTSYYEPVDTTYYEPVDTGEVVTPVVPNKPVIHVPTIREEDNVTEFPHNPVMETGQTDKQEFTMTIEGDYLRIRGTLMARGYGKHYIHCQIIGDSVHLQRFDMDPESTDMILHHIDIRIPGFTEDYYHVTLAEQNDVQLYKQYMMATARAVMRDIDYSATTEFSVTGTTWYANYHYENFLFGNSDYENREIAYTLGTDTLIDGQTWKKFYENNTYKGAFREQDGKVWFYPGKESDYSFEDGVPTLMYDFTLQVGDIIYNRGDYSPGFTREKPENADDFLGHWKVVNVRYEHGRKVIDLNCQGRDTEQWIEGIGSVRYAFFDYWRPRMNNGSSSWETVYQVASEGKTIYFNGELANPEANPWMQKGMTWTQNWNYNEHSEGEFREVALTEEVRPGTFTFDMPNEEAWFLFKYLQDFNGKVYAIGNGNGRIELCYDFTVQKGDEIALLREYFHDGRSRPIFIYDTCTVNEVSSIDIDGISRKQITLNGDREDVWVEGIGSLSRVCPIDGMSVYSSIQFGQSRITCLCKEGETLYLHPDFIDCTTSRTNGISSSTVGDLTIYAIGQSLHCTAPNAIKLEVYTMDAVKVGEARFVNGEAAVKVDCTPALYLYVVTYPDGHRESGKVLVNEE